MSIPENILYSIENPKSVTMFSTVNTKLNAWLNKKLREKGWTQADLAKKSGLSRGTISNLMSNTRRPGVDVFIAVTRAFMVPIEEMLEAAELLPAGNKISERADRLLLLFNQLEEQDQEEILDFIELKLSRLDTRRKLEQSGYRKVE